MEEALAQQLSEELSKQHSVLDEAQVAGLAGWSGRLEVFPKGCNAEMRVLWAAKPFQRTGRE